MSTVSNNLNVALFFYNRPETLRLVFEAVEKAAPQRLFLIADGPNPAVEDDARDTELTRKIVSRITWDCEVIANYSDAHMGCRARMVSGINWVFEHVTEAVILEDDCVPSLSFFNLCKECLGRYRDDPRVMHISGTSHLPRFWPRSEDRDYYFSAIPGSWGWAAWRRAWQLFDPDIRAWTELRGTDFLRSRCADERAERFWRFHFDAVVEGRLTTCWDYQWTFACWLHSGLCVTPYVNLVANIGHGRKATHTGRMRRVLGRPAVEMTQIRHPPEPVLDRDADHYTFYKSGAFLPRRSIRQVLRSTLGNRYFYGKLLRKVPLVGALWARRRSVGHRHL